MINIQTTDNFKVDVPEYERLLKIDGTFLYVDIAKFKADAKAFEAECISAKHFVDDLLACYSHGKYTQFSDYSLIKTLTDFCCVDDRALTVGRKDNQRYSLDKAKILQPLLEQYDSYDRLSYGNACAYKLITAYLEFKQLSTLKNTMNKKMGRFIASDAVDNLGNQLATINFHYNKRDTHRYYTEDDSIQNWSKRFVDSIAAPKDYFFVWCDMSQIDLRVALNIYLKADPNLKKYLDEYDDKYEAFARGMSASLNQEFDPELFKLNRNGYKRGILAAIFDSRVGTVRRAFADKSLAPRLLEYIHSNPEYAKYKQLVEETVKWENGVHLDVFDYFNEERIIPVTEITNQKKYDHYVGQGLNTPVQMGTNSVVILWVLAIMRQFFDRGYSEDQVQVALNRHDETLFCLHKDCLRDLDIFADSKQIAIDDWSLLDSHCGIGYNYSVPDQELTKLYETVSESCKERTSIRTVFNSNRRAYSPLAPLLTAYTVTTLKPSAIIKKYFTDSEYSGRETALFGKVPAFGIETETAMAVDENVPLESREAFCSYMSVNMPKVDNFSTDLCIKILRRMVEYGLTSSISAVQAYLKYGDYTVLFDRVAGKSMLLHHPNAVFKVASQYGGHLLTFNTLMNTMYGSISGKFYKVNVVSMHSVVDNLDWILSEVKSHSYSTGSWIDAKGAPETTDA